MQTLDACLAACTTNGVPSGACSSVDYAPSSRECRLSTDTVVPSGEQQPEFDADTTYYEKVGDDRVSCFEKGVC